MNTNKKMTLFLVSTVVAVSMSTLAQAQATEGHGAMPMINFDAIDANKDGKITAEEFSSFRTAEFAKADTNSDGQISADELAVRHIAEVTARAPEMAAKMIERMDANSDGQLSAEEMERGPKAPSMFERVDENGDGAISKEEADAMKGKMGQRYGKHGRKG